MRRVAVVAFARSDASSCLPVASALERDPRLELLFIAAGDEALATVQHEGIQIAAEANWRPRHDTARAFVEAAAATQAELARAYERLSPDIVLVVGDRFEVLGAVAAALPARIPVGHVSGGDTTEGAIDNAVRYAVTALSHLHFVAMEAHARRLVATGEEPWRIHVTGDPGLDYALSFPPLSRAELEQAIGGSLEPPVLVVAMNPATIAPEEADAEADALLDGLKVLDATFVISVPSLDPGRTRVEARLRRFAGERPRAYVSEGLGQRAYYSLLRSADAIVGNSSSAIWEAPSFELPAVNVGSRQDGRIRARNVIDAPADGPAIADAVRTALQPSFRESLQGLQNPYGDGAAAARIAALLREAELGPTLLRKRFGVSGA